RPLSLRRDGRRVRFLGDSVLALSVRLAAGDALTADDRDSDRTASPIALGIACLDGADHGPVAGHQPGCRLWPRAVAQSLRGRRRAGLGPTGCQSRAAAQSANRLRRPQLSAGGTLS